MPFFGKLTDAQKRFDEEKITRLKDRYKLEYRGCSSAELQTKLDKLGNSEFHSEDAARRVLWMGVFGSMQHIAARDREGRRQAITELLRERGMVVYCKYCGKQISRDSVFCPYCDRAQA
jgi:hypothetical protein